MPNGVNARIPIVNIDGRIYADLCWSICGDPLLLLLYSRSQPTASTAQSYDVGGCVRFPPGAEDSIIPVWSHIRVANDTNLSRPTSTLYFPMNHGFYPAIRIPERVVRAFLDKVGAKRASVTNAQLEWSGSPPTSVTFKWKPRATGASLAGTPLALKVGRCTVDSGGCEEHLGPLWANIRRRARDGPNQASSYARDGRDNHAFPEDHILTWPGLKKRFSVKTRLGRLRYNCAFKLVFVQDSSITLADCLTLSEISVTTEKFL
ncbi:hypothetical protein C8Q80DRAFT_913756 [Daedaleopsis nitida]|nr:hypothetical protein C8Q80DRAFT_913756 [Daedaleopsis nitida]